MTFLNRLIARLNARVIDRQWKEAKVLDQAITKELRGGDDIPQWDLYPVARSYFTQTWA